MVIGSPSPSAREELASLAVTGGALREWPRDETEIDSASARAAAVLVLFGDLDGVPSRREARAPAVTRGLDVLLLARSRSLSAHPGQIAFPGGRVDPDDRGPISAALREATEETGLDASGVDVLGAFSPLPLAVSRYLVTPVLGWWARPTPVGVVDPAESRAVFRAPVADLLAPEARRTTLLHREGRAWRGPAFLVPADEGEPHLLWGFTALILDAIFDRLGWTEPWDQACTIDL